MRRVNCLCRMRRRLGWKRLFVHSTWVLACSVFGPAADALGQSATWAVNSDGSYSVGTNWSTGTAPGSAGTGTGNTDIARFQRSTISASRDVTVDADYNVGGITFDNNAASGSNIFQVGGATFGASASTLTLTSGAVIQNIGSGAATGGINGLDANIVLSGNATVLNTFGNSVFRFGNGSGTSANAVTTAASLGDVDLVFSGTSTESSLMSMRLNQAAGTTLRLVKEGTGAWQFNGLTSGSQGLTGGLLIRQGSATIGRNSALSIGTGGGIGLGDAGTVAGDLRLILGSSVTVSNAITVASSAATNVYFDRGGGSGNAAFSGAITLGRDLTLRQSTTANRTLALNSSSTVGGTGNLIVGSSVASAGAVNLQGGINMDGILINQSTLATGTVTVSGAIGATVKGVTQNSATSSMTLSNASNAYTGTTTVTAGSLNISGAGDIGDSDLVLGGGTFTITSATTGLTLGASQAVTGVGTIITTGKSFVVNGRFAPGASAGAIAVTGDFTLGGSTEMELAGTGGVPGTDFDFLSVSGVLNLGGTLSILGAGGFSLDSLGSYNLFDASSFTSNFSSVQVGSTALAFSGGEWIGDSDLSSYSFSPTTGVLTVVAVPEPASLALVAVALGVAAARKATANGSRRF